PARRPLALRRNDRYGKRTEGTGRSKEPSPCRAHAALPCDMWTLQHCIRVRIKGRPTKDLSGVPAHGQLSGRKMLNGFADRRLPTGRSPRLAGLVAILAFVGAVHETVRAEQDRWAPARAAMVSTIQAHAASLPQSIDGQGLAPAVLDVMGKVPRHSF